MVDLSEKDVKNVMHALCAYNAELFDRENGHEMSEERKAVRLTLDKYTAAYPETAKELCIIPRGERAEKDANAE